VLHVRHDDPRLAGPRAEQIRKTIAVYVGHLAAGLAIKAHEPRTPTWALLVGVGLLDILFGPFVLAGIERASVTPSVSPGFSLDYIDWSHSLVMSLVWSVLFATAFARYGRRVMTAVGFTLPLSEHGREASHRYFHNGELGCGHAACTHATRKARDGRCCGSTAG
jgi:hypothetical protein